MSNECKRGMHTKPAGDGFAACNQKLAAEIERDNAEDLKGNVDDLLDAILSHVEIIQRSITEDAYLTALAWKKRERALMAEVASLTAQLEAAREIDRIDWLEAGGRYASINGQWYTFVYGTRLFDTLREAIDYVLENPK